MAESILEKTLRGAGWAVGWRIATRALGFVSTMILVRLLLPGDFGLVALATGFSQMILAFSSLGTSEAVIREPVATREIYDTAFTINLIRGFATSLVVVVCAWPVSVFFNEPRLMPVLLAIAACSLATGFENIGTIEFFRDFAFDREFKLRLLPRLASVAVTIAAALVWRSHWALVAGIATTQVLGTAMGYAMHPYRPRLSLAAWRRLAGFSFWTWAISVAEMMRDRVDSFVVGRFLGLPQVGVYSLGAELATMSTYELAAPVGRACFAGFAEANRIGESSAAHYSRILATVTVIVLPVGVGMSLVAAPAVTIICGPGWLGAVDVVRILGIAGVASALGTITTTLLTVHGVLRPGFIITLMSMAGRAAAAIVLVNLFGLIGAALAQALAVTVESAAYLMVAVRRFHLRGQDFLVLIWRALLGSASMAACLLVADLGQDTAAPLTSLMEAATIGAVVYGAVVLGAWVACGRPDGPEADLLELSRRVLPGTKAIEWAAGPRRGG